MGQSSSLAEPARPSRARWIFLLYAASLSLILYLDRICIARSAGDISRELDLDDVRRGWMFTAFTLGYLLFEVPSGAWGDRYGPKRVLCRIVICWSFFTVLTGCVWGFTLHLGAAVLDGFFLLFLVRFLFGAAEAGAYPNLAKCSGRWFPLRERGLAQGVVVTAGRIGGGLAPAATIAVTALVNDYLWPGMGWRVSFWLFGSLGVIWVLLFARWFRNSPADHPSVNAAELALIHADEVAGQESQAHGPRPVGLRPPWRVLLLSRNLWAFSAMAFCSTFVAYLYFTRFPEYLEDRHHVPEREWGWVAGLPLTCGALGCVLGGLLTDYLVRRTGSRRWGRRTMGLIGKGGGAVLLLAGASVEQPALAVALISLSAFTSDLSLASHWAVCTDAGGRFVATVFGVMNTVAAVGAALSPVLAGYILQTLAPRDEATRTFDPVARAWAWDVVLYLSAATLAVGALCWLRIDADESMVSERTV
ncbi:MAG TPA: MFS transporter [Gemmataceae bacterium]|nr:MFS transporter [Gemmataceae bacterium]